MHAIRQSVLLTTAALAVAACGTEPHDAAAVDDSQSYEIATPTPLGDRDALSSEQEASPVDAVLDEPDYVVELDARGELISFYVADDGSVGVLAEAGEAGSVLDSVLLSDASPAVIFHAVSHDPVPEELMDLHSRLHADGEVEAFDIETQGNLPGWLRSVSFSHTSSPCLNSTFGSKHCAHSAYNASLCTYNLSNGNTRDWSAHRAHRFKAGVCLQQGEGSWFLRYEEIYELCRRFSPNIEVWPRRTQYATTYLTYRWWRPSGANRRSFRIFANAHSGGVMDVGIRWSGVSCP